jgi:hypothetical protein
MVVNFEFKPCVSLHSNFFSLQGMNFVTAFLLLVVEDEESVFWLLDALTTRLLPGFLWAINEGNASLKSAEANTEAERAIQGFLLFHFFHLLFFIFGHQGHLTKRCTK